MAQLANTTKAAIRQVKARIVEKFKEIPESGNPYGRIRFAEDYQKWLELAAVELTPGVKAVRAVFVYWGGWATAPAECRTILLQPIFYIEVIQSFYDGTEEDNSTQTFEDFLADSIESFKRDPDLGFTEGTNELSHNQLQGAEGDGRPEVIDGIFAHRKVISLQVNFRI